MQLLRIKTKSPNNERVVVPQNTMRKFTTNSKIHKMKNKITKEKKEEEENAHLVRGHI